MFIDTNPNEVLPKTAPTSMRVDKNDDSGHWWLLQQGKEFWCVESEKYPAPAVKEGEKGITNRGSARRGGVLDRIAERMVRIEKLTPRK